jgi:benzoyl-CoA 2,3-dioxygenase component B
VALRNAMNEIARRAYIHECANAVGRWNRLIAGPGHTYRLSLPSRRFHRAIGAWAQVSTDPEGRPIDAVASKARHDDWLPSAADRAFVGSLMQRVTEPGKMAGWIAPPERGIDNLPIDYEYVRL